MLIGGRVERVPSTRSHSGNHSWPNPRMVPDLRKVTAKKPGFSPNPKLPPSVAPHPASRASSGGFLGTRPISANSWGLRLSGAQGNRYPLAVRYRLTIAYEGTDFHGWQRQLPPDPEAPPGSIDPATGEFPRIEMRTVQGVLLQTLAEVFRVAPNSLKLLGASRTDSGVHALAQTAVFTLIPEAQGPPKDRIMDALNSRLPEDVVVTHCAEVGERFNPIGDCVRKGYRYLIHDGRARPLWNRRTVHHCWVDLDHERMHDAAQHIIGEHDFRAFTNANHGRESTVRTVETCTVTRLEDRTIAIDTSANGYLLNMVRIIAGTLIDVGKGKSRFPPERVLEAVQTGDRTRSGPTAPPEGLCLMWGEYPKPVGLVGKKPGITSS